MKSLSYIGVIRELENNRIPIKQIIGIEWGALIGALYAKNAQSNFVEWQMFKFKDELLPNESFWSAKTGGDDIQNWNDFLQSSLAASNIENFKIPMKCLSYSLSSAKAVWIAQSKASEQLKKCISSFALYKPYQAWTAHLDFYNELAYELSRYKNQKIIILDSITKTNLAKDNSLSKREESLYIWQRAQQNMLSLAKTTKYFVAIDTTDYPLASASDKRDLVQQGQKAAEVLIRKIQNDYNF